MDISLTVCLSVRKIFFSQVNFHKVFSVGTENDGDVEVAREEPSEKHIEPHVCSSRLPLVLAEKVHCSRLNVDVHNNRGMRVREKKYCEKR
ncbi:hypothetical protein L1049_023969 [Liquidambar formosana]|uniref:Uncharacterized protein n=1 Tax=Liquidambar formosana TaxID=63359 RepID=A0AAP0RZY3_LIQFO